MIPVWWRIILSAFLVAGLALGQGPPQKHDSLPRTDDVSVDVDLVSFAVGVTDTDGIEINGLSKDQFKVFDDNVPQQITHFSAADDPGSIAFLVGAPRPVALKMTADLIRSTCPDNWCSVIGYDRYTNIAADFTKDGTSCSMV